MLDGVDDRLAHGDADPVQLIFVEAGHLADVIGDDLHEIEHVEGAVEFERTVCGGIISNGERPEPTQRAACAALSTIALQSSHGRTQL